MFPTVIFVPISTKVPELRPTCKAYPGILILTAAAPAQRRDSMTAGKTEEGKKKKKNHDSICLNCRFSQKNHTC